MALGYAEFLRQLEEDLKNPPKCPCCKEPFEPRVDGVRNKLGGTEVCDDCYYDVWGKEIDEHPIARPRVSHGAH